MGRSRPAVYLPIGISFLSSTLSSVAHATSLENYSTGFSDLNTSSASIIDDTLEDSIATPDVPIVIDEAVV